ncbi:MAG: hypothetical protein HQK50_09250 [Oligoflexia bacterium]|nr:hypothetical protein [Oligoflexia bacterium]
MPNIKKPDDRRKKPRTISVSDYHLKLIKTKFTGLSEAIEFYAKKIERKGKKQNIEDKNRRS